MRFNWALWRLARAAAALALAARMRAKRAFLRWIFSALIRFRYLRLANNSLLFRLWILAFLRLAAKIRRRLARCLARFNAARRFAASFLALSLLRFNAS